MKTYRTKFHGANLIFSIAMDPDTHEEVLAFARANNLNRSDAIRHLIDWGLETIRTAKVSKDAA